MLKEEQIRNEVIDVARNLFDRFGYNKTTMEDIARATGRGKSTLYYYFSSKDEIFEAVSLNQTNEVFTKVREAIDKVPSAEEKLKVYISTTFTEFKKKTDLFSIGGEIFSNYKRIERLRKKIDSTELNIVYNILNLGIKNKEFCINDKSINMIAYLMVNTLRGMEIDLLIDNKVPDWKDKVGSFIDMLTKGLKG